MILEALRAQIGRLRGSDPEVKQGVRILSGLPDDLRALLTEFDPEKQNAYDVLHQISADLAERELPNPGRLDLRDMMEFMERAANSPGRLRIVEGGKS